MEVVSVTADQGVRIPIALDGALVDGADRNAAIIAGRPALIRAFYEVDPGFETREIAGKLILEQADGTISEHVRAIRVYERDCGDQALIDCNYSSIPRSFWWKLPGENVQPGATYRIELFEVEAGHEDDVTQKNPVFPIEGGTLPLGVEASYMKMRVVLVPFDHDLNDSCPAPPDLLAAYDDERTIADLLGERLKAQNPVEEVEIIVHEVVPFYGSMQWTEPLTALQQLREDEGAPPEYYYYGVGRPCDGSPDFAGVAYLGGATKQEAHLRVGWGVDYAQSMIVADTFVHEIGHEQGRRHIRCSGDEATIDPNYPDEDGDTVSWGTDVIGDALRVSSPSNHDYMTYCSNTWVSEWGWNKVYPWIEELSSWELEAPEPSEQAHLLVGTIRPDGSQSLFTTFGHWGDADSSALLQVRTRDGRLLDVPARTAELDHVDGFGIIARLPEPLDDLTSLELIRGTNRTTIDATRVRPASSLVQR